MTEISEARSCIFYKNSSDKGCRALTHRECVGCSFYKSKNKYILTREGAKKISTIRR